MSDTCSTYSYSYRQSTLHGSYFLNKYTGMNENTIVSVGCYKKKYSLIWYIHVVGMSVGVAYVHRLKGSRRAQRERGVG